MRVAFLFSEYVLHNHIIETYARARPSDELYVVKVPLVLKSKGRIESAQRILPRVSRRFVTAKLFEHLGLLIFTYLPKLIPRGAVFRRLRKTSKRVGAQYRESDNIASPDLIAALKQFQPDVIVTLMHQIVKHELLVIPRLGVLNIHPGVLPDFRGIQPYFWALSEGAAVGGCSIHFIDDESIDTGGIVATSRYPIASVRSVQLQYYLTALTVGQLLPRVVSALERGDLKPEPQDAEAGNYFRWPDSAAYDRLWSRGANLLHPRDFWHILSGKYDQFEASELKIFV